MLYKTFLGFDCAYKSFAWVYIDINVEIAKDLELIYQQYMHLKNTTGMSLAEGLASDDYIRLIDHLEMLVRTFVRLREASVIDLLNGRKVAEVNEIDRALALKQFLVGKQWPDSIVKDTSICIEHQPPKLNKFSTNNIIPAVAFQLGFHFCDKHRTIYVDPKLKNGLAASPELTLEAVAGRKPKYIDRKKHVKLNFIEFARTFNLDISHIDKKRLADVADAMFTIFAAIANGKLTLH